MKQFVPRLILTQHDMTNYKKLTKMSHLDVFIPVIV